MRWRSGISPTGCAAAGRSCGAWPREERVLTPRRAAGTAAALVRHGFDIGEPSGRLGLKTRAAVRDFQARSGLVPDGFATAAVLERLRAPLTPSSS